MFFLHLSQYLLFRRLQHLIVHVTSRCNFRCPHCFVDFSTAGDLPLETCRNLAKETGRIYWLDIGGGEPFLRRDLPDVVAAMPAEVVMIPSNGSRTEVVVDQVREIRRRIRGELGISLSLEGFQKTNDRLRREGSWETVWKTFEQLRAIQGVSVKINTVLRRENADELLGFMREVRRRGPDFHSVILLRGDTADASQQLPDPQHLAELVPGILEEIDRYTYGRSRLMSGILRNYHRHAWDIALRTLAERRQVIPCLGGCAHSVVWADGTVSPCEMLPAVGSLHDAPLSVIRRSADWQHWRESIRRGECWCTHNCALLDSVFFNPVQLYRLLVQ